MSDYARKVNSPANLQYNDRRRKQKALEVVYDRRCEYVETVMSRAIHEVGSSNLASRDKKQLFIQCSKTGMIYSVMVHASNDSEKSDNRPGRLRFKSLIYYQKIKDLNP
jgi:hypothetical protein